MCKNKTKEELTILDYIELHYYIKEPVHNIITVLSWTNFQFFSGKINIETIFNVFNVFS